MKKMGLWFWLLTKRQLKSVAFWLVLVLIPLTAGIVPRIEAFGEEPDNCVALYSYDDGEISQGTIEELLENKGVYTYYLCDSEEMLYEEVRSGNAQCGYIFNENAVEKIKDKDYDEVVKLVKKQNSIIADAVNESFFSVYFKYVTKTILMDYVENNKDFAGMDPEGLVQLEGAYNVYLESDVTARVDFEMLKDGSNLSETEIIEVKKNVFPLRSIMAILIMAGGMLGVVTWLSDREKGVFVPMKRSFIATSKVLYVFIPAMLLGASTFVSLIACQEAENVLFECVAILGYVIVITILGAVCCTIFKKSYTMVSIMPVVIIACILICPVFIDLALYVPGLNLIRNFLVPYYYIRLF